MDKNVVALVDGDNQPFGKMLFKGVLDVWIYHRRAAVIKPPQNISENASVRFIVLPDSNAKIGENMAQDIKCWCAERGGDWLFRVASSSKQLYQTVQNSCEKIGVELAFLDLNYTSTEVKNSALPSRYFVKTFALWLSKRVDKLDSLMYQNTNGEVYVPWDVLEKALHQMSKVAFDVADYFDPQIGRTVDAEEFQLPPSLSESNSGVLFTEEVSERLIKKLKRNSFVGLIIPSASSQVKRDDETPVSFEQVDATGQASGSLSGFQDTVRDPKALEFVVWLSSGIKSNTIPVNTDRAPVHMLKDGRLFVVAPRLLKEFLSQSVSSNDTKIVTNKEIAELKKKLNKSEVLEKSLIGNCDMKVEFSRGSTNGLLFTQPISKFLLGEKEIEQSSKAKLSSLALV